MLALISNTRREYLNRIFPRKLAVLFRETIFFDEMRKPKSSPDPLLKMMERLNKGVLHPSTPLAHQTVPWACVRESHPPGVVIMWSHRGTLGGSPSFWRREAESLSR
ncbi:MAG: hypothetical protein ACE5I8_02390 [Thermodesulfobacteriota bacterium]